MAVTTTANRSFYLLLGGLIIGAGAVLWFMSRRASAPAVPVDVAVMAADTAGFRGYVLGEASAPVEVIEFADYQCPACQSFDVVEFPYIRERLIASGRIRYVYKDFPLDQIHRWARLAAHAGACADEQGRFWEMHEGIYRTQSEWAASGNAGARFRDLARAAGTDVGAYDDCMRSLKYAGRIQAMLEEGLRLGVNSTPSFIVGGRLYTGVIAYDRMRAMIDSLSPAP